jgi:hypothetical protein
MAIAIPPSDMMLAVIPIRLTGMKASRMEMGMVRIGMRALGMCQRKSRMTRLTTVSSSRRVIRSVAIERSIKSERS